VEERSFKPKPSQLPRHLSRQHLQRAFPACRRLLPWNRSLSKSFLFSALLTQQRWNALASKKRSYFASARFALREDRLSHFFCIDAGAT
jgi:hypothetical protein